LQSSCVESSTPSTTRETGVGMTERTVGERYRLDVSIGRGGMATVYRARDLRLERDVAVKLLASDRKDDPAYVRRFVQEAKLSARLRHPNLVEVFDVALSDENELYLVMELLDGRSLGSVIGKDGLALPEFFRIAAEITSGLRVLHEANVVHRDVSSNNVMLVRHGDRIDHVKVLDLGIAKAEGQQTLTEPGSFIGTLESMSPEQIRGEALDARADVYALGVLFFRMLVGSAPFSGEAATLMYHHLQVRPERVQNRVVRELPPALVDLVARCLEKDPALRPADATAVHDALEAARSGSFGSVSMPEVRAEDVPDLAPHPVPVLHVARPSTPLARSSGEAVLEPTDEPLSMPLELAPVERREGLVLPDAERCEACGARLHAGSVVCTTCGQRPLAQVTPFRGPDGLSRTKLPAWLAPLGVLPVTVGKRVSGYAFLGAVLSFLFFRGGGLTALGLVAIGLLAAAGVYIRSRNDEEP
jgi:serine/threonine protein kinase